MAEDGGERKGKVPLLLDWNKVMSSGSADDDEPPPLLVVPEVEMSKQLLAGMDDEDAAALGDRELRRMPMRELEETIKRGTTFSAVRLRDGGAKLQNRLKCLQAELERRNLQKDDGKCNRATSSGNELTCIGANCSRSIGAFATAPASKSAFALHLYSKLDDKTSHQATNSFREEISTLNRCDNKNVASNSLSKFQRTQETGLPSRQMPFESPIHLSEKNDKQIQSNDNPFERQSSMTSAHPFEESISGCFPKMENTSCCHSSRVSRRCKRKAVCLVDEEELEVDGADQSDQVDQSIKETRIYYPSRDDPEAIEICRSDMQCLTPGSYLSSTIMNFYIRYLQKPTSPKSTQRCDYHFFNTYFYKKLKGDALTKIDKETSFVKFRRWWKGVNIFEKAYIFLPIHENLHWSLIIICIPDKKDESGPIILHLDSLGMHASDIIFDDVKRFLIGEWKFLKQEVQLELPIADKIWEKLSRRIDEKVIEVPQQKNEYDCGLFVLFFMERFIDKAPGRLKKEDLAMFGRQWFRPQEASNLRQKIKDLLEDEFKNANVAKTEIGSEHHKYLVD